MRWKTILIVELIWLFGLLPGVAWSQIEDLGEYTAQAAFLEIGEDPEKPNAEIFHMSYTLDGADASERPVTFVWNGGPGASSVYLHMLALGPRMIEIPGDGTLPKVPARLIDNPQTWLHFTDLVFIDPVGTGYSRALPQEEGEDADPKPFYDADRDLETFGQVIRTWLTQNERWSSPKGIAGESYGGRRVAALSLMLMEDFSINLNWATLISPALNDDIPDPDSPYGVLGAVGVLPSYAAVAAYHGETERAVSEEPALGDFLEEVEGFALGDFASGLVQLSQLSEEETAALFSRIAGMTGLPAEDVEWARGRIAFGSFITGLLEDRRLVVDPYDGTQTALPPLPGNEVGFAIDHTLTGMSGVLSAPFLDYLGGELGVETPRTYEFLNRDVNRAFDRDTRHGGPEDVARALAINPDLKVLVVHGMHDLVTPYFKTRYALEQTVRGEDEVARLEFEDYQGGHMFYMYSDSRNAFYETARAFYSAR
ncbi:S10 family peptidase [Amaricoccus macauensis]|uniref:S10 family peptidase n=1 Tax=Amaricoccus macauensis TaxID=57001 RepID=UPI003C7E5194